MARGRATTKKQAAAGAAAVVAEEKAENGVAQNGEGTPTRLVLADCMPIFFSLFWNHFILFSSRREAYIFEFSRRILTLTIAAKLYYIGTTALYLQININT